MNSPVETAQSTDDPLKLLEAKRQKIQAVRERARKLFERDATGMQVASVISDGTDAFLVGLFLDALGHHSDSDRKLIAESSALVALGGSGRGEMSPYSDSDLMFLHAGPASELFTKITSQVVRDCWDANVKLGHSVRTINEAIALAKQETEVTTALIEARLTWGSELLFEQFQKKFYNRVIRYKVRPFVEACITAREEERKEYGTTVSQLEPDIKRSLGGLRDIHLLRWIGYAHYRIRGIDSLRRHGTLTREDARLLTDAQNYIMRLRHDLHFHANKEQDVLTRDEQLRLTEQRRVQEKPGQRPVERFMQEYFRHSGAIANITQQFVQVHRRKTVLYNMGRMFTTHRANRYLKVGHDSIDVLPKHVDKVTCDLSEILRLYRSAALYGVLPTPKLVDTIRKAAEQIPPFVSPTSAQLFLDIMRTSKPLGPILRSLYETGILDILVPDVTRARGLLQFNQYHSYTVDEHTLRAVEAATAMDDDDGPLGAAYQPLKQKEILHLALLLHDLGKGFEKDHSDVGLQIAERITQRLYLSEQDAKVLKFLVHKHLLMSHLAFRRDISDPKVYVPFSHQVGNPKTLRMLYVLSAADLIAVGPKTWTDWKAELLSELYDRAMVTLSGKHHSYHLKERIQRIRDKVISSIAPVTNGGRTSEESSIPSEQILNEYLDRFSPQYLIHTAPYQIAADIDVLRQMKPHDIIVRGIQNEETGIIEYRVIVGPQNDKGCFYKTTGTLSAKRLEILSAEISTNDDGVAIDSFRVIDNDFEGLVSDQRLEETEEAIRKSLLNETSVPEMFQRNTRYGQSNDAEPISGLPTRVSIDNSSSDRATIIDIFCHDRLGLLYTIGLKLHKLELALTLAKISTHFDQVVDVFYVTDETGRKITDTERLNHIKQELYETIAQFEREGYLQFVR